MATENTHTTHKTKDEIKTTVKIINLLLFSIF